MLSCAQNGREGLHVRVVKYLSSGRHLPEVVVDSGDSGGICGQDFARDWQGSPMNTLEMPLGRCARPAASLASAVDLRDVRHQRLRVERQLRDQQQHLVVGDIEPVLQPRDHLHRVEAGTRQGLPESPPSASAYAGAIGPVRNSA